MTKIKTEKKIIKEIHSSVFFKNREKELESQGYEFPEYIKIINKEMKQYIFPNQINNRIEKDEFVVKDNLITVIPEKLFSFRTEKEDVIYKDGERYTRTVRGYDVHKYEQVPKKTIYLDFDLLGLNYKFKAPDYYWTQDCIGQVSKNEWVNAYSILGNYKMLDKRIKGVYFGKGYRKYYNYYNDYSKYWNRIFLDNLEVDVYIDSYGWSNHLWYTVSATDILKIPYENIKKYAQDLISLFEYIGIDFKKDYNYNLQVLKKTKNEYDNEQKQTDKRYNYIRENIYDNAFYKKIKQKTYILKDKNTGYYKIGKSTNPLDREKTLQSEKPTYELIKIFNNDIETKLHKKYKKQNVRGEWFDLSKIQLKYICTNYK